MSLSANSPPLAVDLVQRVWDLLIRCYLVVFFAFFPLSGALRGGGLPKLMTMSAIGIAVVDVVVRWARLRVGTAQLLVLAYGMWFVLSIGASTYPQLARPTLITVVGWAVVIIAMTQVLVTSRRTMAAVAGYVLGSLAAGLWGLVNVATGVKPTVQIEGTDTNDLGFYTSTAAVIAISICASRGVGRWPRMFFGLGGIALSLAVAASLSRGSLMGLAAGLLVVFVTSPPSRSYLLTRGAAALLAFVAATPVWMPAVAGSLKMKQHVAGENVSSRLDAWVIGANLGVDHPLSGIGPWSIAPYIMQAEQSPPGAFIVHVAHNTFVEALYSTGVVGLGLLGGAVYTITRTVRRTTRVSGGRAVVDARPGAPMLGAIFCAIICSMFTTQVFNPTMWLIMALGAAGSAAELPHGLVPSWSRRPGRRRVRAPEPQG